MDAAPNAHVPTSVIIRRWGALSILTGFGTVYLIMVLVGFTPSDALWLAGISIVPLAVALLVALWVWRSYWKLD